MLRDLRIKIRTRHSRISSCAHAEFLPLSKQFFAFLEANSLLRSLISELLARNPKSVEEARTLDRQVQVYGETSEEAATIAYTRWQEFASQDNQALYYHSVIGRGGFDEGLDRYRDWYVEPLFDYLDEALEDSNVILATLGRYKHKVEWYRRDELLRIYTDDTARGEKRLARHMYEFLFDQGIPFHVEPAAASGRPDVVSLEDSEHPFIGDVKIFEPDGGRGAAYVKKGLYQVYRYCWDYSESVGYLIVFNLSSRQLRFELPSSGDGVPRFEYNHKTIFILVIDLHLHDGTASTRGVPETVTIAADELVREVQLELVEAPEASSRP